MDIFNYAFDKKEIIKQLALPEHTLDYGSYHTETGMRHGFTDDDRTDFIYQLTRQDGSVIDTPPDEMAILASMRLVRGKDWKYRIRGARILSNTLKIAQRKAPVEERFLDTSYRESALVVLIFFCEMAKIATTDILRYLEEDGYMKNLVFELHDEEELPDLKECGVGIELEGEDNFMGMGGGVGGSGGGGRMFKQKEVPSIMQAPKMGPKGGGM